MVGEYACVPSAAGGDRLVDGVRLGELLVRVNAATSEQVAEALRSQVLHGGRLGTNLVELGIIELEPLSTLLADLQRRPAALQKHFESPDRDLQQSFAAHLARLARSARILARRTRRNRVTVVIRSHLLLGCDLRNHVLASILATGARGSHLRRQTVTQHVTESKQESA